MNVQEVINKKWAIPGAVGIATVAGGLGVGYLIYRKRKKSGVSHHQQELPKIVFNETLPDRLLDEDEVEERVFIDYAKISSKKSDVADDVTETTVINPDEVEEVIEQAIDDSDAELDETEGEEIQNIFASNGDEWDLEEEKAHRHPDLPYVIHQDEYMSDELDFTQHTLTWYAGDDVLVDEADKPVYNHHEVTGDLKFGHGTNDPNVVYIRNEKLKSEYEILRHSGHFAEEIMGLEADAQIEKEIMHQSHKFRDSD